MEATYKTDYSDVGREDLAAWLWCGLVAFSPKLGGVPESGKWLAALRACDGSSYVYKVCDSKEDAKSVANYVYRRSKFCWVAPEVWHVVEGSGVVEHVRRETDGMERSIRLVCRVL